MLTRTIISKSFSITKVEFIGLLSLDLSLYLVLICNSACGVVTSLPGSAAVSRACQDRYKR